MNEIDNLPCKECGKPVPQTKGKRTREYCSIACRSNNWQKRKRNAALPYGPPKSEKPADTKKKKQEVVKEAANDLPPTFPSEKSFRVYIEMINTGNWDRTVIEKDIRDNKRLTGPQKSMLYAKLNH